MSGLQKRRTRRRFWPCCADLTLAGLASGVFRIALGLRLGEIGQNAAGAGGGVGGIGRALFLETLLFSVPFGFEADTFGFTLGGETGVVRGADRGETGFFLPADIFFFSQALARASAISWRSASFASTSGLASRSCIFFSNSERLFTADSRRSAKPTSCKRANPATFICWG